MKGVAETITNMHFFYGTTISSSVMRYSLTVTSSRHTFTTDMVKHQHLLHLLKVLQLLHLLHLATRLKSFTLLKHLTFLSTFLSNMFIKDVGTHSYEPKQLCLNAFC